ncbi:A24 family peptidase [Pelagibius marinus]|uniref:A24 family peptidase n=1 Tax=Pelagibius marinus TaxID=2762760 RepID=UPI0018733A0D|nr:prepilin peptidase [Pelagibius marinus]
MDMFLLIKVFFWAFVALLVLAAAFDLWKFTIPNWISVSLFGLFVAAGIFMPVQIDWLSHLGALAVVLLGTLALYRFRVIGGGDLKLLVVVGLWTGLDGLPEFILMTAFAGGVLALGLIGLRRLLMSLMVLQTVPDCITKVTLPRFLLPGEPLPYGVAIAVGGILVARHLPHLGLFA